MIEPLERGFKMDIPLKIPGLSGPKILIISIFIVAFSAILLLVETQPSSVEAELLLNIQPFDNLILVEENSLLAVAEPSNPPSRVIKKFKVIVTAYSSSPWETDQDPHITAAGTYTRDGVVANNLLPLGTRIKIPELFGDKVFVVEDRMSWKKGYYQVDVWLPSYQEALNFGAKTTYIEILED